MPRDKKTAPVESWRLPKEQRAFQKKFRDLKGVQELLQLRTLGAMSEMEDIRKLWQALEGEFHQLKLGEPREPVRELHGMDFGEEPTGEAEQPIGEEFNIPQTPMLKY